VEDKPLEPPEQEAVLVLTLTNQPTNNNSSSLPV
jgi:hypothetical protein